MRMADEMIPYPLKNFVNHPNKSVFAFSLYLCKISPMQWNTGVLLNKLNSEKNNVSKIQYCRKGQPEQL